jgi:hypothetical protein
VPASPLSRMLQLVQHSRYGSIRHNAAGHSDAAPATCMVAAAGHPPCCRPHAWLQHDIHIPILTVGETLDFASAFSTGSKRPDYVAEAVAAKAKEDGPGARGLAAMGPQHLPRSLTQASPVRSRQHLPRSLTQASSPQHLQSRRTTRLPHTPAPLPLPASHSPPLQPPKLPGISWAPPASSPQAPRRAPAAAECLAHKSHPRQAAAA